MSKLGIDIDGCLADFTDAYAKLLTAETGIEFPPQGPTWPDVWYWERAKGVTKDQEIKVWNNSIMKGGTFWQGLGIYQDAIEAVKVLNDMARKGDEVYFITNRMGDKAKLQTEKWLYNNGVDYPTVIVTGDKIPFLRALGINFFIDDKPETVEEVSKTAAEEKWKNFKLYLKKAPYNNRRYAENVLLADSVMQALEVEFNANRQY